MRRYWYTLILAGSIIVAAAISLPPGSSGISLGGTKEETALAEEVSVRPATPDTAEPAGAAAVPETTAAPEETPAPETTAASEETTAPESAADSGTQTQDFSHTLFIGDSRTEGLKEYGGISEAEFFANSGLSTFNVFSVEETLKDGSRKTLDQVLSERSYDKIYLMLGINELGYSSSAVAEQYSAVLDRIQTLQPGAYVILEANLHVTKEKSDSSDVFTNGKINALNYEIYQLAVSRGCGYLDVNGLFDDGQGNLDPAYSSDSTHVMGKYYAVWGQWLRTQAV